MENLQGKYALITGSGRGLGKATAIAFAQEGIHVAITGRNESKLIDTVKELEALGVKAAYKVFDITDHEGIQQAVNELTVEFGSIDILVNNAGTGYGCKNLD